VKANTHKPTPCENGKAEMGRGTQTMEAISLNLAVDITIVDSQAPFFGESTPAAAADKTGIRPYCAPFCKTVVRTSKPTAG
jgi:hypothetical protein